MSKQYSRRAVIRLGTLGLASIPVVSQLARAAESGEKVDESSQQAQELNYHHDASEAEGRGEGETCQGCAFYQGAADAEWGGCIVFGGKQVNANGWCSSFRPKTG